MKKIDNSIEERRVGIDNAKLLDELGFDVICKYGYNHVTHEPIEMLNRNSEKIIISAPTQSIALDWIRINFDIHVYVNEEFRPYIIKDKKNLIRSGPLYRIENGNNKYSWVTPEEATEAAINFILTKQIVF